MLKLTIARRCPLMSSQIHRRNTSTSLRTASRITQHPVSTGSSNTLHCTSLATINHSPDSMPFNKYLCRDEISLRNQRNSLYRNRSLRASTRYISFKRTKNMIAIRKAYIKLYKNRIVYLRLEMKSGKYLV